MATPKDELLVGIEIHQQLSCATKLFCACPPVKSDVLPFHFERKLRPAQSETGRLDPAALFEYSKGRSNLYFWNPESSCLVEADEEPPHPLNPEGLDSALIAATTLGSHPVDEVHVMRKIVIDGSNTGGFQRTAVVGLGGELEVGGVRVGVQSVTLEEDAARILGEDSAEKRFALDRLGVALVEVALDPVRGDPDFVGKVALHLGRALRSTRRVARGLGTIRQDLNVSYRGGKVVEVKGVQKLNLVPRVVEYERRRQSALTKVADALRDKGVRDLRCRAKEVTELLKGTSSGVLSRQLSNGGKAVCLVAPGLAGLIGWEPEPGVRLGKELAEVARASSLGGIIHSDEFQKQGITASEASALSRELGADDADALVIIAGPEGLVDRAVGPLRERVEEAPRGVPPETRAATESGETRYMRPRPGSQRMYPETDIPDIVITEESLASAAKQVPENWQEAVRSLREEYSLSEDMAMKVYDSDILEEFERLAGELSLEPSFVAAVLVDVPARLGRDGVPDSALGASALADVLRAVDDGLAAKEAVPDILKAAGQRGQSVKEAIAALGLGAAGEAEVRKVVEAVVAARKDLVAEKGDEAFSPLMGEAMKQLRGRADGAVVSRVLRDALRKAGEASD